MSYEKRGLLMGILLLALACTCGPIQQITDTAATLDSAAGTAAGFATEVNENMPTFQALGTEFSDVSTEMAPTLTALAQQMPELEATMTAAAGLVGGTTGGGQSGNEIRQWASSATASSEYTPDDPDWAPEPLAHLTHQCGVTGQPGPAPRRRHRLATWRMAHLSSQRASDSSPDAPAPSRASGGRCGGQPHQCMKPRRRAWMNVLRAGDLVSGVSAAVNHVVITCPAGLERSTPLN
jgi:hypothetical protein